MTTTETTVTVSGDSDPQRPACGAGIVPARPRSSSHDGLDAVETSGGVGDAPDAGGDGHTPLRLGGGMPRKEKSDDEWTMEGESDPDPITPEPQNRLRLTLRSKSTARRGGRKGGAEGTVGKGQEKEKEKDPEKEKEKEKDPKGGKDGDVGEVRDPVASGSGIGGTAAADADAGPSTSAGEDPSRLGVEIPQTGAGPLSRDVSPASIGGASTGSKRAREEEEEEVEILTDEEANPTSPSSKITKRRKDGTAENRGRPALNPANKGEFSADKVAARKLAVELRKQAEVDAWFDDPTTKATTVRAMAVEPNALRLLSTLKEVPTASITQMGIDSVERLKKVAASAKHMKGTSVGVLWKTAEEFTALNLALTTRVQAVRSEGEDSRASELEDMRREISSLRTSEALLRGQVRSLREAVAQGEAARAAVPPTASQEVVVSPKRGNRGGERVRPLPSTTSSGDTTMDMERVEQDLSPIVRDVGRIARQEVERDRRENTIPPANRPPLHKRPTRLELGGPRSAKKAQTTWPPPAVPVAAPPGVGTPEVTPLEEILRAMAASLASVGVSLGTPVGTPTAASPRAKLLGARALKPKEKEGRDPLLQPPQPVPQGGPGGGKKKRNKKKKKRKKGQGQPGGTSIPQVQPGPVPSKGKGQAPPAVGTEGPAEGGSAPARPPSQQGTWAKVVGRKERKRVEAAQQGGDRPPVRRAPPPSAGQGQGRREGASLPRGPRGAAVTLTCPEGRYAETMTEAREKIRLEELGISGIRTRRAVTGALILEIPGQEGAAKAEALRKRMADLFAGREDIKVTRPVKRSELRLRDLDDSVTANDVRRAVTESGECEEADVQVGPIRRGPNGMGTAWVRCPLLAARKLVAGGRLTVGWAAVRVEALTVRPLQCFRCLKEGHVRANCPSEVDRSGVCYRCGSAEHRAGQCTAAARCAVCADANLPSGHRLGGRACKGVRAGTRPRKGAGAPPPNPKGGREGTPKDRDRGTTKGAVEVPPREEVAEPPPLAQRERFRRSTEEEGGSTPMEVCQEEAGAQKQ